MNKIENVKNRLKTSSNLSIVARSMYMPTEEKVITLIDGYLDNPNIVAYGYNLKNKIEGLIILDISNKKNIVILNIAINTPMEGRGIGSKLIDYSIKILTPKTVTLETDDYAVEFYKRYGFTIIKLDEKYKNTTRYQCKYFL